MTESKITKEHLLARRDEILDQLSKLDDELKEELDRDSDEQAIQLESQDVTLSVIANLNKELAQIEEKLLDLEA